MTSLHDSILEHVAVGIFTVNTDFRITSFNRQAEKLTGFTRDQAMGRRCYEIFRADACRRSCPLRRAMDSGRDLVKVRVSIIDRANREIPVEITAATLKDDAGRVIGGVESFVDDSERALLAKKLKASYGVGDIVGRSPAMVRIFESVQSLASSLVPVLIQGETGTGKGLLARAIHNVGSRAMGPFIKVNCAALPENLLESELFGYRKGAFTDARKDKPGMFELACGGTLFLDEIGEIPLSLQAKLLQAIEDREFFPLGATAPARVDVRMIASTNRDLESMVQNGEFRIDLYYRLRVAVLQLPPLRERSGDIPLLAERFLSEIRALGPRDGLDLHPAALRALMDHDFPGNVRELKNALEYAAVATDGQTLRPDDLPAYFREQTPLDRPAQPPEPDRKTLLVRTMDACR
ncbi:MAG: PAS domain-containing protein, partial [Deltaproteobacteria bacterium]|nr:PAS domain-containing protein [Deltaproteobacteria bacterium]